MIPLTLGIDYQSGQRASVIGWLASEKLDGCRAYWDGSELWSREGNIIAAPHITDDLPQGFALDGEIWAGRSNYEVARRAVQYGQWIKACAFVVFDAPGVGGCYQTRIHAAAEATAPHSCRILDFDVIRAPKYLASALARVLDLGGEGLMLRNPAVKHYEQGRTANLLELKSRLQLC